MNDVHLSLFLAAVLILIPCVPAVVSGNDRVLLSSLMLLVSGVTVVACVTAVVCILTVAGILVVAGVL